MGCVKDVCLMWHGNWDIPDLQEREHSFLHVANSGNITSVNMKLVGVTSAAKISKKPFIQSSSCVKKYVAVVYFIASTFAGKLPRTKLSNTRSLLAVHLSEIPNLQLHLFPTHIFPYFWVIPLSHSIHDYSTSTFKCLLLSF